MKKLPIILGVTVTVILIVSIIPSYSSSYDIPSWVKGVANFWVQGNISDDEFGEAITFLIEQGILKVEMVNMAQNSELENKVNQLESENARLQTENNYLKNQNSKLQIELNTIQQSSQSTPEFKTSSPSSYSKLYELLPANEDLGSEWTIVRPLEYNKATKNFYYENAGQTKYEKDVNFINEFRMNVFKFYDSKTADEAYDKKYLPVKEIAGFYSPDGSFNKMPTFGHVVVDENDCIISTELHTKNNEILGWCKLGKYLIFIKIVGFYPQMEDDAVDFMNIARQKVVSKT